MGTVSLADMSGGDNRPPPHFGASPKGRDSSAMRIVWQAGVDGGLVYQREDPIRWAHTMRMEIFKRVGDAAKSPFALTWWRLEVLPAARAAILPGECLVVTEHPYSSGWTQPAVFKPGRKKSGHAAGRDPAKKECESVVEALAWIEQSPHDPWDKTMGPVAGVSLPSAPIPPASLRNAKCQAMWVFGVCADFDKGREALRGSERVNKLLDLTRGNRLRPWHPNAGREDGKELRLFQEVIDQRDNVMELAIRQALAGPHQNSEFWIGRPVVDKVDDIYCGHMNNLNRIAGRVLPPNGPDLMDRYREAAPEDDDEARDW